MQRQTVQRQAILRALGKAGRPLDRRELLELARHHHAGVGMATVNRAIRDLTASGQLLGVDFPGQPIRYELVARSEHPHFICRSCRKVFNWDMPIPEVEIKAPPGFRISGHEILFYGVCPECRT